MTYQLYNRDGSGGFVVEAVLALAVEPFELIRLDSKPGTPLPESFRDINPWRQVPVLITPEGDVMTESAAIVIHLAACHPNRGLGPAPSSVQHGALLRWMVFMSSNLYEAELRINYPERWTVDPNGAPAIAKAAVARMEQGFELIDKSIESGPFILGEKMSVADVYLAMFYAWYEGDETFPRIDAITQSIMNHPVVAPIWQRNFG